MFIVCPSCAGNGEGVFGHSWTDCPVCHGAGEIAEQAIRRPTYVIETFPVVHCRTPVRIAPRRKLVTAGALDPTEVFPQR